MLFSLYVVSLGGKRHLPPTAPAQTNRITFPSAVGPDEVNNSPDASLTQMLPSAGCPGGSIDVTDVSLTLKSADSRTFKVLSSPELAFSIYHEVICSAFPSKHQELDDYLSIILDLAVHFGGLCSYDYHCLFSLRASPHLQQWNVSMYWGYLDLKLYCSIFVELYVVTEGETADLTCKTTCSLTDPTFIWYKNGRPLTTKTIENNQLHLQTVSSEDAGSYSCAVRGSQHLRSTAHSLRVRHPPKSVSVSIRPSGEIVEGSSVTLTCSSDGNPPMKIYTWFEGSTPVGAGKTYSIPHIRSEDSGEYTCQSRNDHGERRSSAVQINVTCKILQSRSQCPSLVNTSLVK
ncbi:hypothetical protein AOLI_G00234570 [Acnodon oligacanthus]